jgi:2-dehydropantoate 2-reductase
VMREVVATANADLAAVGNGARLDSELVVAAMFGQTRAMGDYLTSMCIDFREGRPLEVEAILGEPVRRARMLGVEVPLMDGLYALVRHQGEARTDGSWRREAARLTMQRT